MFFMRFATFKPYFFSHILLAWLFDTKDITSPENSATVIPVAVADKPPEKAPKIPFASTASLTPLPIAAPKPISGVETPAPKILKRTSYVPSAYRSTPTHTYDTRMRAGVSFVRSMRI